MTITFKMNQGDVLAKTCFKFGPGEKALKFAKHLYGKYESFYDDAGLNKVEPTIEQEVSEIFEGYGGITIGVPQHQKYGKGAYKIASDIIDGKMVDHINKKVKRCQCCGYYFHDNTKNNSATTCSRECKNKKDTELKDIRRQLDDSKTKRKLLKDEHYFDAEYSFYASDYWMREYDRRHQSYSYGDNFEAYVGYNQVKAVNGGKRVKVPQKFEYNGTEKVKPINVKLPRYDKKVKTAGKVKVYKMSREEIHAHLLETYGVQKLADERRFAQLHSVGKAY